MKQGWEIKKLGEVCNINYGTRVVQKKDGGTIYPVYGGGGATFKMDRYNREDCLIVSRFAMSNQCVRYVCGKFFLNDSGLTIESNESELSQSFLDKHITALNDTIYSLGKGIAQKNLDIKELRLLDIKYPKSREEQERIVAELDCLNGVIERKREQLRELDALVQSIFYQMFGDPITNEKGWEVKKLEELCDIINGFAFPSSDFAECNPIKVIKITNVGVNEFISDDSSLPEEYNNMEGCKVHTGNIVIALTRTIISTGVKRAIVPNEYNESLVNQRVAAISANDRIVSRRFLYSYLGTDFVRQYILQKATALMQPNLSIRDLRDMPTIYPPLASQQEFADKIEAIEKQKVLIKQSITQTEELFNSRMDYYFN